MKSESMNTSKNPKYVVQRRSGGVEILALISASSVMGIFRQQGFVFWTLNPLALQMESIS